MHQTLDTFLGNDAIIDVAHEVADTIENHEIGLIVLHRRFQHREPLVITLGPDVKDVEAVHRKLILSDTCHRYDTVAQDILRRFLALFGVIPEDMQLLRLDPLNGEYLAAVTESHQDGTDKRLTTLSLSTQSHELPSRETGFMKQTEEELHLRELFVGRDTMHLQLVKHLSLLERLLLLLLGLFDVGLRQRSALHFLIKQRGCLGIHVHDAFFLPMGDPAWDCLIASGEPSSIEATPYVMCAIRIHISTKSSNETSWAMPNMIRNSVRFVILKNLLGVRLFLSR